MKRVLVTGSRTWTDESIIQKALEREFEPGAVLVSGACPRGGDEICERLGAAIGYQIERHPADWKRHGRGAGFRRNVEMVQRGADVCLGFVAGGSRGASHTVNAARAAGLRVVVHKAVGP